MPATTLPSPTDRQVSVSAVTAVIDAWAAWDRHPTSRTHVVVLERALEAAGASPDARQAVVALRHTGSTLAAAVKAVLVPTPAARPVADRAPVGQGSQTPNSRPAPPRSRDNRPRSGRTPAAEGSSRYRSLATDGETLRGALGHLELQAGVDARQVALAARTLEPTGELVVWVHRSAGWDLTGDDEHPAPFHPEGTMRGDMVAVDVPGEPVWLAPADDFAGAADVDELLAAVLDYHRLVGLTYAYSAGSTAHALIRTTQGRHRLGRPHPHPEIEAHVTAWATPAHNWSRPVVDADRELGYVAAFDRNASYLSAWAGTALSDGAWSHHLDIAVDAGPEGSKPAGYWLVDTDPLDDALAGWPNPFDRRGITAGPRWLTTPLAQLAAELAHHNLGVDLVAEQVWWADTSGRYLTKAGDTLRDARTSAPSVVVRDAVKATYVRGTAWFDKVSPSNVLHRPHWRRTILDRYVANTWRRLLNTGQPPLGQSDIDCIYLPVAADGIPADLTLGAGLGQFKPAGPVVALDQVDELLDTGDTRGFVRAYHAHG